LRAESTVRKGQTMTLKTILVPLLGAESDLTALETAVAVARRFDAHIEALFVAADPRDSVLVLGDGMSTLMLDEIMQAAEATRQSRLQAARRSFEAAAVGIPEAGVPGASTAGATIRWRDTMGRIDQVVAAEGRLADLTVMAAAESGVPSQYGGLHTECLETALLSTGRPVLLAHASAGVGEVVAVAWNGTLEASRAVAAALPWLGRARQVHVLTVGAPDNPAAGDPAAGGDRLAASLAWHGIAARVSPITPGCDTVAVALLRRATELGVDLLVMGAYGHSRMREMILGGATRHILTHPGPAVLLAH